MTEKEVAEKYANIEDKIPSIWPTWEKAGIELAQDIVYLWDIKHHELIRVISAVSSYVRGLNIIQHIDPNPIYQLSGLYPHRIRKIDI